MPIRIRAASRSTTSPSQPPRRPPDRRAARLPPGARLTHTAGAGPTENSMAIADPLPLSYLANARNRHLARNWGWVLLRGLLAILCGALAILLPGIALASLMLLFAAYMLADGIIGIVSALRAARAHQRWGWLVVEGILGIAAGLLALLVPAAA